MLDLSRIQRIELSADPWGQKMVAACLLAPNYHLFPGIDITLEGLDRLPDEPVIYAMNHTDRYNYWPFQYRMWLDADRFTATWVKGKYYQDRMLAKFMEWTNNIPTVSRGYLIGRDFLNVTGRRPTDEEYRTLREQVDAATGGDVSERRLPDDVPPAIYEKRRRILGMEYHPTRHHWAMRINDLFRAMMGRFVELNGEALDKGLDLLVFPQGTRSIRLTRGRIGLAQIAMYYDATIVPVGCNGSDEVYPADDPFARSGDIVYRIGEPIGDDERTDYQVDEPFEPFTAEAEQHHRDRFQAFVDLVMDRINDLLAPRYQFAPDDVSDSGGADRFV
jgi:1-acyl-sn-glycerol-3-phosphate acyltransferase